MPNVPTQPSTTTNQNDQSQPEHVTMYEAAVGILLIVIGILIVFALSAFNVKPVISGTLGAGIDVFAVLYIDAQFIERLVEPFSDSSTVNKDLLGSSEVINQAKNQMEDQQDMVNTYRNKITSLQTDHVGREFSPEAKQSLNQLQDSKKKSEDKVDSLNKKIDTETMRRVISFWGLTSLMGMVLVYFSVGIFSTIGLTVADLTLAGTTILHGHGLDAIITGVIVGAGTKPLHDLIGTLQKSSSSGNSGNSSN
jgi:hypothetical protein